VKTTLSDKMAWYRDFGNTVQGERSKSSKTPLSAATVTKRILDKAQKVGSYGWVGTLWLCVKNISRCLGYTLVLHVYDIHCSCFLLKVVVVVVVWLLL